MARLNIYRPWPADLRPLPRRPGILPEVPTAGLGRAEVGTASPDPVGRAADLFPQHGGVAELAHRLLIRGQPKQDGNESPLLVAKADYEHVLRAADLRPIVLIDVLPDVAGPALRGEDRRATGNHLIGRSPDVEPFGYRLLLPCGTIIVAAR